MLLPSQIFTSTILTRTQTVPITYMHQHNEIRVLRQCSLAWKSREILACWTGRDNRQTGTGLQYSQPSEHAASSSSSGDTAVAAQAGQISECRRPGSFLVPPGTSPVHQTPGRSKGPVIAVTKKKSGQSNNIGINKIECKKYHELVVITLLDICIYPSYYLLPWMN